MATPVIDSPFFHIYIHELWGMAEAVSRGCEVVFTECPVPEKGGYIKIDPNIHSKITSVLSGAANIKKLLAVPDKTSFKETKEQFAFRKERTMLLNVVLGNPSIPEMSLVEARNSVEHFDQYLDRVNLDLSQGNTQSPGIALYNMVLSSWKVFDKKAYPLKLYVADERCYFNLEGSANLNVIHQEANHLIAALKCFPGLQHQDGPGGLMVKIK